VNVYDAIDAITRTQSADEGERLRKLALRLRGMESRMKALRAQAMIPGKDPDYYRSVAASQSNLAVEFGMMAAVEKHPAIKKEIETMRSGVRRNITAERGRLRQAIDFEDYDFGSDNASVLKHGMEKFNENLAGREMKEDVVRDIRGHAAAAGSPNAGTIADAVVATQKKEQPAKTEEIGGFEL
jgi:hypothetical protein